MPRSSPPILPTWLQSAGLIGAAKAALGPVGLLVNNASMFEDDCVLPISTGELWDRHFAIHVKAPALLARKFAAALSRKSRRG